MYKLNIEIEKQIKYLNTLRGNLEWHSKILSSRDFITPIDLKKALNHCQWDSLQLWTKLFRYGGRDYTVRKAEKHFLAAMDVFLAEKTKVYESNSNYFYSCVNKRGLR